MTNNKQKMRLTNLNKLLSYSFILFIFSLSSINAQNSRPSPTPRQDIPEVISRDNDSIETNDEDVNEIPNSDSTKTDIKLPRQNTTSNSATNSNNLSKKQRKMMLYLDLLTRMEQRASSLRKEMFAMIEKQNTLSTKIIGYDYLMRPEVIASSTAGAGSLRPETLREQRKKSLELEKANFETLLGQVELSRRNLEVNVARADSLVEKIRIRFDKLLDDALNEDLDPF